MGFRIMPGIQHGGDETVPGQMNEPVQRTMENILETVGFESGGDTGISIEARLEYLFEVVAWLLIELAVAEAIMGHEGAGVSNGVDLPFNEGMVTTEASQITMNGAGVISVAEGHNYAIECFIFHTLMQNNRTSQWSWHDGTNNVGFDALLNSSADAAGAVPASHLTAKLVGPGTYTLRRVGGTADDGAVVAIGSVIQGAPGNTPPTAPTTFGESGAEALAAALFAARKSPLIGPWP